jgi:cell division protein FtsB
MSRRRTVHQIEVDAAVSEAVRQKSAELDARLAELRAEVEALRAEVAQLRRSQPQPYYGPTMGALERAAQRDGWRR